MRGKYKGYACDNVSRTHDYLSNVLWDPRDTGMKAEARDAAVRPERQP